MSARTRLAEALTGALGGGYRVIAAAVDLDSVTGPTVLTWASRFERAPRLGFSMFTVTLETWVVVPGERVEAADDALDDAFEDLLAALQPLEWVQWESAERGLLYDRFHGWKITATAVAKITPGD